MQGAAWCQLVVGALPMSSHAEPWKELAYNLISWLYNKVPMILG